MTKAIEARKKSLRVGEPYLDSVAGRMIISINGVRKYYSHYIYFLNTGYWLDYENKREIIHHIDGNSLNDDFKNLELMTESEHHSLHNSGELNPQWQGNNASINAKYQRHRNHPESYLPLTESERMKLNAYFREKSQERKLNTIVNGRVKRNDSK